jgi:hypothetical protein
VACGGDKQTKKSSFGKLSAPVDSPDSNFGANTRSANMFWTFIVRSRDYLSSWTDFITDCPGNFDAMKHVQSFWPPRISKSFASGIVNGERTAKAFCSISGMRYSGAPVA